MKLWLAKAILWTIDTPAWFFVEINYQLGWPDWTYRLGNWLYGVSIRWGEYSGALIPNPSPDAGRGEPELIRA